MKHSVFEIALIGAILQSGSTFAIFLSKLKYTLIRVLVIIPSLYTISVLLIIFPFTFIMASLSVTKDSITISFTVFPLALVDVAVSVGHPTNAFEDAIFCEAFIFRFVWKDDYTESSTTWHFILL